jgi:hypothetical protein
MPLLAGVILIGLVLAAVFLRRIWRTVWVTLLIIGGILVLAFFILPSIGHYRAAGPAMRRRILLEAEFAGKRAVPQAPAPVAAIKTEGSLLHVAKDAEIGMKQKAMGKEVAAEQIPRFEDVMKESLQEAADKKGAAAVQMLRKRVLTEEKRAMPAQVLAEAQASAAQPAPAPGAPLTAATRRAGEISVVGGKAFVRAPQKPQRGAQPVALTAPATVAPIAALDKLAHMQQEAAAPQLVVNLVGGRAKGALPIEISFPTAGTVSYEFRMPFAGTTQGTIRLTCIRAGAALCLQGIIGIAVLGIGLGFGWRRTKHAALVSALCVILFGLLRYMASPASAEYLRTAHWAVILVFVVLLVKLLAARVLRPATLAP